MNLPLRSATALLPAARMRRSLLLALALLAALAPAAEARDQRHAGTVSAADFRDPDQEQRAKFTWWWPGPAVEDAELRAEVAEMSAAGFGGAQHFETPGLGHPTTGNPPERLMWGTPHWAERIRTAFEASRDNDFTLDLQASSGWPWSTPAVTGENIGLSAQHLNFGHLPLTGPTLFEGPVPAPDAQTLPDRHLVAVTAARRDAAGTGADGQLLLDPESTVELTGSVAADGTIRWQVPAGDWVLFGFWQEPTRSPGASASARSSGLLVDHLNSESAAAATDYLDEHLFPYLGNLPSEAGGTYHNDSLEAFRARLLWTGDFLDEFSERRGYELVRYLPALSSRAAWPFGQDGIKDTIYDFPGSDGERVRRDYAQTLTELWVDEHIRPVTEWSHRHGLESGGRALGAEVLGLNYVAVTKAYDVPDADHVTNPMIDAIRTTTSGGRLSGARKITGEVGDLSGLDYMMTLSHLKRLADRLYVAGVNEQTVVGYPYKYAAGADWPSWWPWSSEYPPFNAPPGAVLAVSDNWTPNNPAWKHLPRLADYMGRVQTVLQAGVPVTDVAVFRDAYGFEPGGDYEGLGDVKEPLLNSALTRAGFSFDILDPGTLTERRTRVQGKRLIVQRPGYSALVVDPDASYRHGVVDNRDAIGAAAARRILGFALRGLPVVFVSRYPERGDSYRNPQREDRVVNRIVAILKRLPNVQLVADPADLPAALASLKVEPELALEGADRSAEPCGVGAQCVYSVHRRTREGEYWFLWNDGAESVELTGSFDVGGKLAPQVWDPWSGEREPAGLYRNGPHGRTEVPLRLASKQTVIVAFEPTRKRDHVISTSAEEVVADGERLYLRSTSGGNVRATLDNGHTVKVTLPQPAAPIEPSTWNLHVDGYVREGAESHDLVLADLADWRTIPQLTSTSGIGTYRTTVTLNPSVVAPGRGAYLELGRVEGGVQVRVNGRLAHPAAVPPPRIDVGPLLKAGVNAIEVELSTTLKNRLVEMGASVPGYQRFLSRPQTQPYGLLGPVELIPYTEHRIR